MSRVAERVVHQQLMTYLEPHKLITEYQYGFRQGRSTEMALLSVTEPILQGMKRTQLLCLFNLSRAIDCVPHNQLLQKLRSLGIEQPWLRSYLKGRAQTVKVGNTLSKTRPVNVNCGVPQGSILGPVVRWPKTATCMQR